jgi:hypothetical protein
LAFSTSIQPPYKHHTTSVELTKDKPLCSNKVAVRKTPSWPRRWANSSRLQLYSRRNAWANLHLLGQLTTFLAIQCRADGYKFAGLTYGLACHCDNTCDAGRKRWGAQGGSRGPLGLFARTSMPCVWSILCAFPPETPWLRGPASRFLFHI